MSWQKKVQESYMDMRKQTILAGGREKVEKEHKKGKLTARERLHLLFDDQKFSEMDMLVKSRVELGEVNKKHYLGDGVIAGFGKVNGKTVYAVAQDCTVSGGAGGEAHVNKICHALEKAIQAKCPFVCLCDSGGARIEEGIISLAAYSRLFYLNTRASGFIPQIAAIMGNCAGGSSYSPAMCDFVFMVNKTSQFFITGPKVIKALTGETIAMDELGGTEVHGKYSGQAHFICEDDSSCIQDIRSLLCYILEKKIPYLKQDRINYRDLGKQIEKIIPENMRRSYDVREVVKNLVDDGAFFEILKEFAANMIIGFSRLDGRTIGIVANQPSIMGGSIDCDASDKCARFVRICDSFDIPLLVLVDVPGFYPGSAEERKGILRHGSKILYAFAEACVPSITLIMRKAYGGAYCAMNSKNLGADIVYAWPICEIAVMGADGAVDVMYHKEIQQSENPEAFRQEQIEKYEEKYLNPYFAAAYGMVDEVILPEDTRDKLKEAFDALEGKQQISYQKKHGNIPL